jgi:hypothetical protein
MLRYAVAGVVGLQVKATHPKQFKEDKGEHNRLVEMLLGEPAVEPEHGAQRRAPSRPVEMAKSPKEPHNTVGPAVGLVFMVAVGQTLLWVGADLVMLVVG